MRHDLVDRYGYGHRDNPRNPDNGIELQELPEGLYQLVRMHWVNQYARRPGAVVGPTLRLLREGEPLPPHRVEVWHRERMCRTWLVPVR